MRTKRMNVSNSRRPRRRNKEAMRLAVQFHILQIYIAKNVDASELTLYPGRLIGDQKLNYSKKKKLLTQVLLRQCVTSYYCQSSTKERNSRRKQLQPKQLVVGGPAALTQMHYYKKRESNRSQHKKHRNSLREWKQ